MKRYWTSVEEVYPSWKDTQKWVREVRRQVLDSTEDSRTSFNTTVRVVEAIAEQYGRWEDKECLDLKESLIKLEDGETGRVRLGAFYQAALDGAWQFSESK